MDDSGSDSRSGAPRNLAIVVSRLPARRECRLEPVDDRFVVDLLASGVRVTLFVDQASEASEALRSAGLSVWTAPRRRNPADGLSSDAARAREILRRHRTESFDGLLMSADTGLSPTFVEPELDLPLVLSLGGGPLTDLEATWQDGQSFAVGGQTLRAQLGTLAVAEALVTDVQPGAFGMESPAILRRASPPSPRVPSGIAPPAAGRSDEPGLRVLVATTSSLADLASIVECEADEGPRIHARTTLAVIVRAASRSRRSASSAVAGGVPRSLARQIVIVEQGEDEVAVEWLERADEIVLASPRESAIPAVADAVRRSSVRVHGGGGNVELVAPWIGAAWPRASAATRECGVELLGWDGGGATAATLERLAEGPQGSSAVLLHSHDAPGPLFDLLETTWPCADVVVWGAVDPVFGQPGLDRVASCAVALRRPLWRAAARVAEGARDVSELVHWALQPAGVDRVSVLSLPAPEGVSLLSPAADVAFPVPVPRGRSFLPPARFRVAADGRAAASGPATSPPPLPPKPTRAPLSVLGWARRRRWRERLRLALPWRFGLLARAMEGRW
ncbi:MAG: hypothetical protein AB7G12_14115 [Thermoanaerobaculia bacterium]